MTVKVRERIDQFDPPVRQKNFYEDDYAVISFLDSVPCIKLKVSGVPRCSEHFQRIHQTVLQSIRMQKGIYCRLHMLTDNSRSGIVLNEDIAFYNDHIVPQFEKSGIRYHAIVLPESNLVRTFLSAKIESGRKIHVEYFSTVSGASKWLRHR